MAALPTRGLVAYWPLDTNLNDASGNNNNAIAKGNLNCSDNPGFKRNGCSFGIADQYLDISSVNDNINSARGTISAWAYPTAEGQNRYVIQGLGANTNRYYIQWNNGSFNVCRGNPGVCRRLIADTPLNRWYALAMTWDTVGSTQVMKGYLNGELKATANFIATNGIGGSFKIGTQGTGKEFLGLIDEIRFYDRALSDEEVRDLYEYDKLAGYLPFDRMISNVVAENSGLFSGQIFGPIVSDVAVRGKSFSFNGSQDYIDFYKQPLLDFTNSKELSLSVWVNQRSRGDINDIYQVIYNDAKGYAGESITLDIAKDGKISWAYNDGSKLYGGIYSCVVPLNKWTYIASTFGKDGANVYLDSLKCTLIAPFTKDVPRNKGNTQIGKVGNFSTSCFDGLIDELKIFRTELDQQQIKDLFYENINAVCGNFVDAGCAAQCSSSGRSVIFIENGNGPLALSEDPHAANRDVAGCCPSANMCFDAVAGCVSAGQSIEVVSTDPSTGMQTFYSKTCLDNTNVDGAIDIANDLSANPLGESGNHPGGIPVWCSSGAGNDGNGLCYDKNRNYGIKFCEKFGCR